jgi:hypothetical protein
VTLSAPRLSRVRTFLSGGLALVSRACARHLVAAGPRSAAASTSDDVERR